MISISWHAYFERLADHLEADAELPTAVPSFLRAVAELQADEDAQDGVLAAAALLSDFQLAQAVGVVGSVQATHQGRGQTQVAETIGAVLSALLAEARDRGLGPHTVIQGPKP
jgi:hypothetical protein